MYIPKLGPYNAMALGIALELAEFCYFLLLRAGARLLHFWVCRLVGMVARHNHNIRLPYPITQRAEPAIRILETLTRAPKQNHQKRPHHILQPRPRQN